MRGDPAGSCTCRDAAYLAAFNLQRRDQLSRHRPQVSYWPILAYTARRGVAACRGGTSRGTVGLAGSNP
eukprot:scaffold4504_cov116-Isochrysis_galbana.AAC.13